MYFSIFTVHLITKKISWQQRIRDKTVAARNDYTFDRNLEVNRRPKDRHVPMRMQ